MPFTSIKRGDIVLLKLNVNTTLDYEEPPRCIDPSFFPHRLSTSERDFPFRLAVVRKGHSTRRRSWFGQLETVVENSIGKPVLFDNLFLYKANALCRIKVEYNQAASIQAKMHIPIDVLTELEQQLLPENPTPLRTLYDSDDEETRTISEYFLDT
ncbi:hypothetical protein BDQ17DRAFT_260416 [Cyathus striatus]|nr:hypothetical protein BDQ17DRAFT_260416 [Cyathus striatus]